MNDTKDFDNKATLEQKQSSPNFTKSNQIGVEKVKSNKKKDTEQMIETRSSINSQK